MKKISSLFIALLFILVAQSVQAAYIPIDIPIVIRDAKFTNDYLTVPPSTLGGIPFHFPGVEGGQTNDFFYFYDNMPNTDWTVNGAAFDTMTMPVQAVSSVTTAYLLLNTNWGALTNAGMVTFNTSAGDSLNIALTGNVNIRDWNSSGGYFGTTNTQEVFSVTPNAYSTTNPGSTGRIDMLTVDLKGLLNGNDEYLTSIVFTDYGSDELSTGRSGFASRIRIEGVTIQSIPEPSTLLLLALGLGVLGFVRTRFSKA
jgi:hypothetical protein